MDATPKTAIIGAGISGLTSAKNLADAGVEYDCFESSDRVGGNWAFRNPNGHSSAYRSLHIDTSRDCLSFKDFPMSDDLPDYPHHTEVKAYLDDYTDALILDPAGAVSGAERDDILHAVRRTQRQRQQARHHPTDEGDQDGSNPTPGTQVEDPELGSGRRRASTVLYPLWSEACAHASGVEHIAHQRAI